MTKNLKGVIEALKNSRRVLVCSHVEPDGDSIGSQLALAELLVSLGKEVRIVNQDPVPQRYRFLDHRSEIRDSLPEDFQPDTAVIVDCPNQERLGKVGNLITNDMVIITIDHHQVQPYPDDPAYVDLQASSTGELISEIIWELKTPIGPQQANRLYAAIFSDTGGFRFPNTTGKSLQVATELVRRGANPHHIAASIYEQRSLASLRLLGCALDKLDIMENGRVTMASLGPEDMKRCQADPGEAEGIVDVLITIKDVLVGVLTRQIPSGMIKVNLRTRGQVKANLIAEAFGGGGHTNAAGYRTRSTLDQTKKILLDEIRKWL
jgi:phosphoesterase RecJ-like protein